LAALPGDEFVTDTNLIYSANTDLTKKYFDDFLESEVGTFIFVSTAKVYCEYSEYWLSEDILPVPESHYAKSKLLAEDYLLSKNIPADKRLIILRPSLIYGPGNRRNIYSLFRLVNSRVPWFFNAYNPLKSFCFIDNFNFVVKEIILRQDFGSGVYNVADNNGFYLNDLVREMRSSVGKKVNFVHLPKIYLNSIKLFFKVLKLKRLVNVLEKFINPFMIDTRKLRAELGSDLPYSSIEGLSLTLKSFYK
jgi:nucleoside-diphosphate-sugar epimerase